MKIITILFLSISILFSSNTVIAQQDSIAKSEVNVKEQLKSGVLLVRLSTKENQINALRANGFENKAREVAEAQAYYNKEIIKAFKEHYTYSPVYFFFSGSSKEVLANELKGIFVNEDLDKDPGIMPTPSKFYIAEIGDINTEYGGGSVSGLYLMNADFKRVDCSSLDKFCSIGMFNWKRLRDRTPAEMVEVFNKRLIDN